MKLDKVLRGEASGEGMIKLGFDTDHFSLGCPYPYANVTFYLEQAKWLVSQIQDVIAQIEEEL